MSDDARRCAARWIDRHGRAYLAEASIEKAVTNAGLVRITVYDHQTDPAVPRQRVGMIELDTADVQAGLGQLSRTRKPLPEAKPTQPILRDDLVAHVRSQRRSHRR
jgi:hypothetical protein